MKDWPTSEVRAELTDAHATVAFLRDQLADAEHAHRQQVARTTDVYGPRPSWPASSAHAVDTLAGQVIAHRENVAAAVDYRDGLDGELQRRVTSAR